MSGNGVSYDQPWRRLFEEAVVWERGDLLEHSRLAEILGLNYGTTEYYGAVQKANRELLETHRKHLITVPKRGYRVALANEHLPESRRIVKAAGRRFARGVSVAANAPMEQLSEPEKAAVNDYLAKSGRLKALASKSGVDF